MIIGVRFKMTRAFRYIKEDHITFCRQKTSIQKRDNVFELKLFDPIFFSKKIGGAWGSAP